MSNLAWQGWLRPVPDVTVVWHVGGRERALCVPGHGDGAACVCWQGDGHAELSGGLGGAERRYAAVLSPVGRYGGSAAAKHAGAGGPGRHRRQGRAKCACEASDKQARPRATCQVHCGRVTETVETEDDTETEFLNIEQ